MKVQDAIIGTRVRSLMDFSGVPKGTEGTLDEDYGSGVMICWDLPREPWQKPLRDGFDKWNELHFLEVVD